jgi:SOS-response transcriptional repressors (RecA-mediated autopeptidases)
MNKEFVLHIKSLKKKERITNEKLSELSKVPLGTINKLLSGETEDPQLSTIAAICGVLDVSVDQFIGLGSHAARTFPRRMSLSKEEADFVSKIRRLDAHSKRLMCAVIECELARMYQSANSAIAEVRQDVRTVSVPMFEFPQSAETGIFLDFISNIFVNLPDKSPSKTPDIAIRLSDGSMEPQYGGGDIILVKKTSAVKVGHLGVFSVNGAGYFRIFSGGVLTALNDSYADVPLAGEWECIGAVVGVANEENH